MKTNLTIFILFLFFISSAQNREKVFELNQKLGRGINYGNMFEAPTETGWGNPWQPEYAGIIADLGFNHVRIPIRWEPEARSSSSAPYTINPDFMARIKQVVDSALNNGLYAIINMHHHEALYENPENNKARFLAQWQQISEYFADYPDSLLFEILNEPHGNMTADKWNVFLADALTTIRIKNPERAVLIGTAEYGGLGGLSKLQLPDDDNIILTIHYYNPFAFTHQGAEWVDGADVWLGTKWTNTVTERNVVANDFAPLKAIETQKNIPIHIGEFGSYSKADINSRENWTTYMGRYIESLGWSWAYWEFSAGFGIYKPASKTYNNGLIDALVNNKMPEPARYVATSVYTSDFEQSVGDWNLSNNSGASSTKLKEGNNLKVAITTKGSQGWHIQLTKTNIALEAGKKYRLSFKAKAETARNMVAYVGKNSDPWSAYSSYENASLADTFAVYTYVFDMKSTDYNSRIVFDLGTSLDDVTFEYITLESVVLEQPSSAIEINNVKSKIYPNPVKNSLTVNNQDDFQELTITNTQGIVVKKQQLTSQLNATNLSDLPSGIYFVLLSNQNNRCIKKIIKN
ncbi:cellulase family glycosylhydrolase [uncultured Draconibacterium sp.]|uniref:cellulase family glycosylhydrolase n=1 Tax=uncultured Draconibacterium sp. TaxID=1573823 RepID=UPI00321752D3